MTEQDKQLLLKDLCTRLPYGVKVQCITKSARIANASSLIETLDTVLYRYVEEDNIELKPYLRSLSSITEGERNEYFDFRNQELQRVAFAEVGRESAIAEISDWLNEHHFDYRELIPMGLALEAPEGMYKK